MLNHVKMVSLLNVELFFVLFGSLFGHMLQKGSLFGHFREPFGSLRGTFGRLLVTKVPQRLPKVSQKRPNGSKAPQKGFEKTV